MSNIIAFEGPSGSGKDYAVQRYLAQNQGLVHIERPTLPRCLDSWAGAWSSSFLEYSAIAAATMSQQDVLCNRFLLSRWVYRAMQFNNDQLGPEWYGEVARSWRRFKIMAVSEAFDRMGQAIYLHPHVTINVLLPGSHRLEAQRSKTGKLYPFNGPTETRLYGEMATRLIQQPILGVTIVIDAGG